MGLMIDTIDKTGIIIYCVSQVFCIGIGIIFMLKKRYHLKKRR